VPNSRQPVRLGALEPDHMNNVGLEAGGRLRLHRGEEKTAIAGDGKNLNGETTAGAP
jgi:hypothetical protein